jgi:rhomboid family GlyGly-CTERM serine protease
VAALILAAALGGEAARAAGRYERAAVLHGEIWRLVTGHFVHLGWSHTLLNLAGLVLVWMLCASGLRGWRGAGALLASIATIDAGFLLLEPQLQWYVGFSGVLHGLFAAGVVAAVRARESGAWILAALLAGKLVFEQLVGPVPLTERVAGGAVIESAHLYGAIGGLLAGALAMRMRAPRL